MEGKLPTVIVTTEFQLSCLSQNGVVNYSVWIEGLHIRQIDGIEEIKGDLFIWCYQEIPPIRSLGSIKRIGGFLDARSSNLRDLGCLEYVGGDCKLNGSSIASLGNLEYVGGKLQLPLSFKYHLNTELSNIHVSGKTSFHKSSEIRYTPSIEYSSNDSESDEEVQYKQAAPYINYACELRSYELLTHRPLMNANHCIAIGRKDKLTSFGKEHLEDIKPFIDNLIHHFELVNGCPFLEVFYTDDLPYKEIGAGTFIPEYYKQFYHQEKDYQKYLECDDTWYSWWKNGKEHCHRVVEHAVGDTCKYLLREAENLYRESIGLPMIGSQKYTYIRETELYSKLKQSFPNLSIQQHGHPHWLGDQHIDIYFSDYNIGIEYQGLQHYKPVDFFGGDEGFEYRQFLDELKIETCDKFGCKLLWANESTPYDEIVNWVSENINGRPSN